MSQSSLKSAIATLAAVSPSRINTLSLFSQIASGERVDAASGLLKHVSVITEGEAKGHNIYIDPTTINQMLECAKGFQGGVKVKMNHGEDVNSIVGVLKNFVLEGNQLFADLQLLKTCSQFNYIVELAQTLPESFGLSVSFSGVFQKIGDKTFARCSELYSVDIVDAPAANPGGLFSQKTVHLAGNPPVAYTQLTATAADFIRMSAADQASFCLNAGTMLRSQFDQLPTPQSKAHFVMAGGRVVHDPPKATESKPPGEIWRDPRPDAMGQPNYFAWNGNAISRTEFDSKSAADKMEFLKNGGRIHD